VLWCCVSDWDIDWEPSYAEFAHPALIQLPNQLIPVFLFAAALFNLVVQMSNIVTEKELRLRQVGLPLQPLGVPPPGESWCTGFFHCGLWLVACGL